MRRAGKAARQLVQLVLGEAARQQALCPPVAQVGRGARGQVQQGKVHAAALVQARPPAAAAAAAAGRRGACGRGGGAVGERAHSRVDAAGSGEGRQKAASAGAVAPPPSPPALLLLSCALSSSNCAAVGFWARCEPETLAQVLTVEARARLDVRHSEGGKQGDWVAGKGACCEKGRNEWRQRQADASYYRHWLCQLRGSCLRGGAARSSHRVRVSQHTMVAVLSCCLLKQISRLVNTSPPRVC